MKALWSCCHTQQCTGYKACVQWWIDAEQQMAVCSARFVCALLCQLSTITAWQKQWRNQVIDSCTPLLQRTTERISARSCSLV